MFSTISGSMPGISCNCSGVMPPSLSMTLTPASASLPASSSTKPYAINADTGSGGLTRAAMADSTSWRFSSSLLMSTFHPSSLAARRTFWPFLPMASESCESSTITSMCFSSASTMVTRLIFAGLNACVANVTASSEYSMMSIFSPRSSRMMDCTRMPFMPTQAPTLSTSRSRLCTAILVRSPASPQPPRTRAGLVHHADDAAHAVAHAVTFQAGLLLLRQARLRLAQIQNVIGTFHPLHGAVHQFAGAAGILVKDGFALGLAHLLENHLLGGLRRDTAEQVGLFRNADLGADLGFRIDAARLGQRHFLGRVFHHLDRLLDGEKLEGPGLLVQLGDIVLRVAEVLARGDQHGVLDGVQYDLRINALFLAQYLDGLKNRFQSIPLWFCPWIVNPMARRGLPLKLQVRLFYLFEREADLPASGFQADDAIGEARQGTLPMALVFDRRAQGDLGLLPLEPLVIAWLEQLAFEARRADFQRVMAGHHVLDVENGTDLVRDQLAIGVRYALGLVDRNAHKLVFPTAFDFHFDDFNAFGERHALRDLFDA